MNTSRIESHCFDKLNVVFGCKTDTNINVMSNVTIKKFKLYQPVLVLFASLI